MRPVRTARVQGTFGAAGPVRVITDEERKAVEDRLCREGVIGGPAKILRAVFLALTIFAALALPVIPARAQVSGVAVTVAAATGTTGAISASLPPVQGKTNYLCGVDVSLAGTAPAGPLTISPLAGNVPFTYQLPPSSGQLSFSRTYTPCLPGPAQNTAITVTTTPASGATAVDVNLWGYSY